MRMRPGMRIDVVDVVMMVVFAVIVAVAKAVKVTWMAEMSLSSI